jgi:membrane-bound metal-dependent hydrolase YbcI (DUF457 family)
MFIHETFLRFDKGEKKENKRMNIIAHILITILFVELTGITGLDIIWAVIFGVLIDLDHLIKLPLYLKQNGLTVVRLWDWRTPFQEPISYLWVLPLSLFLQTWVPVFFFSIHLSLDYLMSFKKKPLYPFSEFEIKERKLKFDVPIEIITMVTTLCMFVFLV